MTARVQAIDEVDAFARSALPLLLTDEANHTVLLSALQSAQRALQEGRPLPEPWEAAIVVEDGEVVAAARLFRGNWSLSLGPQQALAALGRWARAQTPFAGFAGPATSVHAFAQGADQPTALHMDLPLMRLDGPPAVPAPLRGSLRATTLSDLAQVGAWREAFRVEARLVHVSAAQEAADNERALKNGTQFVWCDESGTPCGLIGGIRIEPTGARIGPVYTPPSLRGRGIGAAMVTALVHRLRDQGARCVFLFTDATNPTSNALYERIGFTPAGRHLHWVVSATSAA